MTVANVLLVPFRPSQPDLDTLPALQEIIIGAKDLNPRLQVFGVLTMAPTNPAVNETEEARAYLSEFPEIGASLDHSRSEGVPGCDEREAGSGGDG